MELKEIALELLGRYASAEASVIYEYSSCIGVALDELEDEVGVYRERIEKAVEKLEEKK